ncbi:MAG: CAP domain-containing protein [Myxococcales bacterium]|nr:CAP domain-containing protein [Myxococcales bacterium]
MRHLQLFSSLLIVWLVGCASPAATNAGAPAPIGTAGATDAPCVPLTEHQGCNGIDRMLCEQSTQSWQIVAECAAGERCVETSDPSLPGAKLAKCELIPVVTADAGAGADGSSGSDGGPVGNPAEVCKRWNADRVDLSEGDWDGSGPQCKIGTLSQGAIVNTTRVVNLYRFLTGMPQVVHDPVLNGKAQACALIMRANGKISHTPKQNWKCYNADGAEAAKKSNLSTAGTVKSVDRYMIDSGVHNAPTLGHRRWILNNKLDKIGVGSTGAKYSCLWVIGGKGNAKKPWVAWPAAGKVPYGAINPYGVSIDTTGWSIQSDTISFSQAKISVSVGGVDQPVDQRLLKGGYGSKYAVAFNPKGWKTEAGFTYHVKVAGIGQPFEYDVEVLDCGK